MRSTLCRGSGYRRLAEAGCIALWAAALAICAVAGARWMQAPGGGECIPTLRKVSVPRGGTLWGLARVCSAPGQDPRAVAAEIRRVNHLRPGRTLQPGTRLLVPDYRQGATQLAQNSQAPLAACSDW